MEQSNMSSIEKYEERFGYKESGTFYCGLRCEYLLFALCICALILGAFFLNLTIMEPAQNAVNSAFFYALMSLIVCAVWAVLWSVAAKMVMTGFACRYECDRECCTITVGFKKRTIYYKEVLGVVFEEMTLLGRTHGYNVTISTLNGFIKYRLVFPNLHAATGTRNTVFGIIDERAKRLRKPQDLKIVPVTERFDPQFTAEGVRMRNAEPVVGAITPEEREIPAEMPSVSISTESVIARLNAELSAAEESEQPSPLSQKLSPTVEQLNIRNDDAEKNLLVSTGTMRLAEKWNLPAAVGVILIAVGSCIGFYRIHPTLLRKDKPDLVLMLMFGALVLFATVCVVAIFLDGRRVSYKANGNEFRVFNRKGKEEISLIYSEVLRVDYKEMKLLWLTRGYAVTITTKYRTVVYNWLFPDKMKFCPFHKTPFQVIIDRCPPFERHKSRKR